MATLFHISLVPEDEAVIPFPVDAEGTAQFPTSVGFPEGEIDLAQTPFTTDDRVLAEGAIQHPWLQVEPEDVADDDDRAHVRDPQSEPTRPAPSSGTQNHLTAVGAGETTTEDSY